MPKLLLFVDKSHSILREIMPEVKDFKDQELHEIVENMCYSISPEQLHKNAAGIAANQWGIRVRAFVFTPEGSQARRGVEVIINPSYVPYLRSQEIKPKIIAGYEGCFSVPLTAGLVNRYEAISATYYNLQGEKIECVMEGFKAQVFQHETDHLNGKLFDGALDGCHGPECLERVFFKNAEEMEHYWETIVRPSRAKMK